MNSVDPYGRNLCFLDRYIIVTRQYKVCFVDTEESMAAIMYTQLHATVRKYLCLMKQIYCIALTRFLSENFHISHLSLPSGPSPNFCISVKKEQIINNNVYVNDISYIYLTTLIRNSCNSCSSLSLRSTASWCLILVTEQKWIIFLWIIFWEVSDETVEQLKNVDKSFVDL
jgi:hypothetical protein